MDLSSIESIANVVLVHWPFISALVIFMTIGQVMSKVVFTKDAFKTRKPVWLFWWGHKTLPLHPIVAGLVVGLIWHNPEAGVKGIPAGMGYFALAGALSVSTYQILKGLLKKQGIDLDLPGLDG